MTNFWSGFLRLAISASLLGGVCDVDLARPAHEFGDVDTEDTLFEAGGNAVDFDGLSQLEGTAEGAVAALHAEKVPVLSQRLPAAGKLQPPVSYRQLNIVTPHAGQLGEDEVTVFGLQHV